MFAKNHSTNAPRESSLVLMVTDFRVHLVSVHERVTPSTKVTSQLSLKDPNGEQVDVRNAYHCDSLLVCITKDNRLVVWNPCIGETKWIQARNECKNTDYYDYYALGYDNKSSYYKILRLHRVFVRNQLHSTESEVYDFASNSWSCVGSTTDWSITRTRSRGMSVKETVYWLALCNDYFFSLLSFDFSTERFQSLPLPADAPSPWSRVALSVARGEQQLCMSNCLSGTYVSGEVESDVWIATKMEDTGAVSWSKFRHFYKRIQMKVLHDHENKVLLCSNNPLPSNNISLIVGDDKYIYVDYYPDEESKCPSFLTYVPNLVQIQQGL